jgi:hypothetical protein
MAPTQMLQLLVEVKKLDWPPVESAALQILIEYARAGKNETIKREVVEDLAYVRDFHPLFRDNSQLRVAVFSALSEIASHLNDPERVDNIRRSSGLISFAQESDDSYESERKRRLCRMAGDAVDAAPLTAPVAISKLRWKLKRHYDSGAKPRKTFGELAMSAKGAYSGPPDLSSREGFDA